MKIETIKIIINRKLRYATSIWPNYKKMKGKAKVTKQGKTLRVYIK